MPQKIVCLLFAAVLSAVMAGIAFADYGADDLYARYQSALSETISALLDDGLPYVSFVDINGDGFDELIVDNNHGRYSTELVNNRAAQSIGNHFYLCKGDCTVYCWNPGSGGMERIELQNDNMFIAYSARENAIIASDAGRDREGYSFLTITDSGMVNVESVELRYQNDRPVSATVNGRSEDASYVAYDVVLPRLYNCTPLSFSMYS